MNRLAVRTTGPIIPVCPAGFSALLAPFMGFAMRRANTKDLGAIKAILEK